MLNISLHWKNPSMKNSIISEASSGIPKKNKLPMHMVIIVKFKLLSNMDSTLCMKISFLLKECKQKLNNSLSQINHRKSLEQKVGNKIQHYFNNTSELFNQAFSEFPFISSIEFYSWILMNNNRREYWWDIEFQ